MIGRRIFIGSMIGGGIGLRSQGRPSRLDQDLFSYIHRTGGGHDPVLLRQLLGAANAFKEGDRIVGVSAQDEGARERARRLLGATRLADIDAHPVHRDRLFESLSQSVDAAAAARTAPWTMSRLKRFLLESDETAIKEVMPGLSSAVIGCVVKLMNNRELIAVGAKVFNPLPGSRIGARGYLGARIQPNSPTDHVDDIRWQVFDGWAYAVGDVLLGTNPVSSEPRSVAAIQHTLQDLLVTFGVEDLMPHCVLSHIDVQAQVEEMHPGRTALWFQSLGGSDDANATFDISVEKMFRYADRRSGKYGFYFETGQGADFTNGHGHGFDMVLHESRKYGFARALSQRVAQVRGERPWVHLNDVAGFIGPEVFRSRRQLVRCCLEDIVMGKLHGLCLGLDVCSTLHMDVSLDDLDWCLDRIMPANPAYLMALPTKIDPMLGYLTTGFQDHVRLRERFGYRVNDPMWAFFQRLGVVHKDGTPTRHFGDPLWIFLKYRKAKGDSRSDEAIYREGRTQLQQVRNRGVFVASGYGRDSWTLKPRLEKDIRRIYLDAKESLWAELNPEFVASVPLALELMTRSSDRSDYILHPVSGERLSPVSVSQLSKLRRRHAQKYDVQIVVSDGLNALAIMQQGHLKVFLDRLRRRLLENGFQAAPENIVVRSGRVRAGYRIGEILFADLPGPRGILHVIGERPGTGHRTFSTYITSPDGATWGREGKVDHNITKVVSGVATTALAPVRGADATVRLLKSLTGPLSS